MQVVLLGEHQIFLLAYPAVMVESQQVNLLLNPRTLFLLGRSSVGARLIEMTSSLSINKYACVAGKTHLVNLKHVTGT